VAEDVEKVNADLVVRDQEGKPYSVRYDQVNAMLLNEFLKEHNAFIKEQRKVQQQEMTITELKSTVRKQETAIAQQRKDFAAMMTELKKEMETVVVRLREQDAKIRRVTGQIELSRPALQMVLNNP